MSDPIRVTVWNEFRHEKTHPRVKEIYPDGIHNVIAGFLKQQGFEVRTATLDEPDHGLDDNKLDSTDVLIWWGHMAHHEVSDHIVDKVQQRVLNGMGLIVLHSGHFSKIFRRMMGTSCDLKWRDDDYERIWVVSPGHPIVEGVDQYFELPEEMYGEPFDIPQPDELVLISWFRGGEVFRSGCCYTRGAGRIFYFRPGHETLPTYHNENVQKIISNAVRWAAPRFTPVRVFGNTQPVEKRA